MIPAVWFAVLGTVFAAALLFFTGANDVANALGTSVGSGALSIRAACVLAAIFELLGATLVGGNVADTLGDGLIASEKFSSKVVYVAAMFSSLFGAGVWIAIATKYALPVSSTHSIIGAVVACALVEGGIAAVDGSSVLKIALSWIVSPLIGGVISALIYFLIRKFILSAKNPKQAGERAAPPIIAITCATLVVFIVSGMPDSMVKAKFWVLALIWCSVAVVIWLISALFLVKMIKKYQLSKYQTREMHVLGSSTTSSTETVDSGAHINADLEVGRIVTGENATRMQNQGKGHVSFEKELIVAGSGDEDASDKCVNDDQSSDGADCISSLVDSDPLYSENPAETWFALPMILTACCVSFGHGGNDVANAIGPLKEIILYATTGRVTAVSDDELWYITPIGGIFIVGGLAMFGAIVMETVGKKIVALTYSKGFAAQFGAAVAVLIATDEGLPISTTSVLIGAIAGIGITTTSTTTKNNSTNAAVGNGDREEKPGFNLKMFGKILAGWIMTLPVAGSFALLPFLIARAVVK